MNSMCIKGDTVSSTMPDTANPDLPPVTQDAPGSDVFVYTSLTPTAPPPPYPDPDPGEEPPPYSAAVSGIYPPPPAPKAPAATCVSEPRDLLLDNVEVLTGGGAAGSNPFDDNIVKRAFVRKVFCILSVQLLFIFTVACVFTFSSEVKEEVQENRWPYILSFIIFAVVVVALGCLRSSSRRRPWNIVGLAVLTLGLSCLLGAIAAFHDTAAVVITMASTLAISLAIIAYSVQARFELNFWNLLQLILAVDLFMFLVYCTFYYTHILDVFYGSLGALLYSLFLMSDSLMIMDRLNPEEYVSAPLVMYLDIGRLCHYLGKKLK